MAEKKIRDLQTDLCIPVTPPAEEKICPSCIPNPDAFVEDWTYSDGLPFLNEKNCEYQVAVMVNEAGDYFRAKEIREMDERGIPFNVLLQSFVLPGIRLILRHFDKIETDDAVCAFPANEPAIDTSQGVGESLSEVALATGMGLLTGGPAGAAIGGALAAQEIVRDFIPDPDYVDIPPREDIITKQSKRCRTIYQKMVDGEIPPSFSEDVIKKIEVPTGQEDDSTFVLTIVDPVGLMKYDSAGTPIGNPQAIELFGRAVDYHFGDSPNMPMKVLISIPYYIIDALPANPDPEPDEETFSGISEVILPGPRTFSMISRLSEALRVYSKYQAYWWQTERASIYQKTMLPDGRFVVQGTGEEGAAFTESSNYPWDDDSSLAQEFDVYDTSGKNLAGDPAIFYIIQYKQSVLNFYSALEDLLKENDFRLTRAPNILGDRAEQVKIVFKPFKAKPPRDEDLPPYNSRSPQNQAMGHFAVKAVWAKKDSCGWVKCKAGFKKFKNNAVVQDQTIMGYIARLNEIDSDLMAKETPPWLDFIVQYTYPPLDVRYESESISAPGRENPISCIIDNAGGPEALRDWMFDTVMSMSDAIAYQFNKNSCKLLFDPGYRPTEYKFAEWEKGAKARAEARINAHYRQEQKTIQVEGKKLKEKEFKTEAERASAVEQNANQLSASQRAHAAALRHPYRNAFIDASLEEFDLDNSLVGIFIDEADVRGLGLGEDPWANVTKPLSSSGKTKFDLLKTRLNFCGLTNLSLKAIQCLMGGVTLEVAYEAIIKATLRAFDESNWEQFFVGLPMDKQVEIREKISEIIGDLPPPWKWQPGENNIPMEKQSYLRLEGNIDSYDKQIEINNQMIDEYLAQIQQIVQTKDKLEIETTNPNTSPEEKQVILKQVKEYYAILGELEITIEGLQRQNRKLKAGIDKKQDKVDTKYSQLNKLSDKERQEIRQEVEGYQASLKRDPDARFEQGTAGKALGQMQEAIVDAYIEVIIESLDVEFIFKRLEKFPGVKFVVNSIKKWDCPAPPMFHPSPKSFLNTLTFSTCKGATDTKLSVPKLPDFGNITFMNIIKSLGTVLYKALEETLIRVAIQVVVKILRTLESAICKAIEFAGRMTAQALTPGDQGGFMGAIIDTFCGEDGEKTKEEEQEIASNLLKNIGVMPSDLNGMNKQELVNSHVGVMKTISSITTKNEIKDLIVNKVENQDKNVLRRLSNAIPLVSPQYAKVFSNPNNIGQIFAAAGNLLSPLQKDAIRNNLDTPDGNVPIDESICLTKNQLDQWDNDRRRLFDDLPGDLAEEWVKKQNDKIKSDLVDMASLAQDVTSPLQEAADKLMDPDTSDCDISTSALNFSNNEISQQSVEDAQGIFKSLTVNFQRDLIGGNLFAGLLSNRYGIVDHILADRRGIPLRAHERRKNWTFLYPNWNNSQAEHDKKRERTAEVLGSVLAEILLDDEVHGAFPETVALWMRNQVLNQKFQLKVNFDFLGAEFVEGTKERFFAIDYKFKYLKPNHKKPDLVLKFRDNLGGKSQTGEFGYGFDMGYSSFVIKKEGMSRKFEYDISLDILLSRDVADEEDIELPDVGPPAPIERMRLRVENLVDTERQDIIDDLQISSGDLLPAKHAYQGLVWWKYCSNIWSRFDYKPEKAMFAQNVWSQISENMFEETSQMLLNPNNTVPPGFIFGYSADSSITFEDLLYVNPKATTDKKTWKYTHSEEEKVLGKSATDNPRVHFLDPAIHGGWYSWPKVYIEPYQFGGMMSLVQLMVPEVDACQPKRSDFLDYRYLTEIQQKVKKSLKPDKRLRFDEECVKKIPFDLIQTSDIHGYIEASIIATIRVYISEFILKSLPILSSLEMNSNNYDDAILQLIAHEMKVGLPEEGNWLDWTYIKRYSYWLHFLEQVFQVVQRRVKDKKIEKNAEITSVFSDINEAQKRYVHIRDEHMKELRMQDWDLFGGKEDTGDLGKHILGSTPRPSDFDYQVKMGAMIGFFGPDAKNIISYKGLFDSDFDNTFYFDFDFPVFTKGKARRFAKLYTLHSMEEQCMVLLKYLISDELEKYSKKISEIMSPRPFITDISKYYIGASNSIINGGLKSGKSKVEVPLVQVSNDTGEEIVSYGESVGDCVDVSRDINTHNSLDSIDVPSSLPSGQFVVEKYVRLIDKPDDESENVPEFIKQRPEHLKGVVSVSEFRSFVKSEMIDNGAFDEKTTSLSDIFGNAELLRDLTRTPTGVIGSIGVKFGVRLCFIPPDTFSPPSPTPEMKKQAQLEKAYYIKQAQGGSPGTRHMFPLASFEKDVLDNFVGEYDWDDENFGEDLKCYVDNLTLTPEFKLLFENVFPLKRIPSLIAIYSYFGFLPSIGEHQDERDHKAKDEDSLDDTWKEGLFEDTKRVCYRMFHGFYESDSWEWKWNSDFDFDFKLFFKDLFPKIFTNVDSSTRWWQRWRIQKDRPFDKDGNTCPGIFGEVFKFGKG